jgi:membrane associated rhomboid family serine protease
MLLLLLPSLCVLQIVVLFIQLAVLGAAIGLAFGLVTPFWLVHILRSLPYLDLNVCLYKVSPCFAPAAAAAAAMIFVLLQIVVFFIQLAVLGAAIGLAFGLVTSFWLARILRMRPAPVLDLNVALHKLPPCCSCCCCC